jgi:hypothetical protein
MSQQSSGWLNAMMATNAGRQIDRNQQAGQASLPGTPRWAAVLSWR